MKELPLLITFLPEPLYTVVMAMSALAVVVFGCALAYRLLLKIIDFDAPMYTTQAADEDTSCLHTTYFVRDPKNGEVFTIQTTPDGYVKNMAKGSATIQVTQPIKLQQAGLNCTLIDHNGKIIREYTLAQRPN